jgi:hypothetical protein
MGITRDNVEEYMMNIVELGRKKKKKLPKKIEVLLKCLPESPYKAQFRLEIEALERESYIKGSNDCHAAMVKSGKIPA